MHVPNDPERRVYRLGLADCLRPLTGTGRAYSVVDCDYETSCWIWRGALAGKGYAIRDRYLVHRRVLEEHEHRPLGEGEQVHHRCRQPSCVNPEHLERTTPLKHSRIHYPDALADRAAAVIGDFGYYKHVAERLGADPAAVRVALARAAHRGEVRRIAPGVYARSEVDE